MSALEEEPRVFQVASRLGVRTIVTCEVRREGPGVYATTLAEIAAWLRLCVETGFLPDWPVYMGAPLKAERIEGHP